MAFTQNVLISMTIILGIFIVGNLMRDFSTKKDEKCQYNIGCYVMNDALNKTELLINRISDIEHEENIN
jgi:hypothetical protein